MVAPPASLPVAPKHVLHDSVADRAKVAVEVADGPELKLEIWADELVRLPAHGGSRGPRQQTQRGSPRPWARTDLSAAMAVAPVAIHRRRR
jgi:hypothetical protein